MEETLSILTIQGFCNKIYDNAHNISGWDPNKGKKNVERGTAMMENSIDFGTGGGIVSEGELTMVQGMYLPIPSLLYGEGTEHTTTYNTTETDTWKWTRNNDTHKGEVE